MTEVYPPTKIDKLLMQKVSPDAIKPSYDQMAAWTRELGRIVMQGCVPQTPLEKFDVSIVMPRGGYFLYDVLAHAFGFKGSRLQALGTDSYEPDGITPKDSLEFTQLPDPKYINGKRIFLGEDVCDTGRTLDEAVKLLMGTSQLVERNIFKARQVTTAAVVYKPEKSETGFVPDYYAVTDNRWIVFPGEVYEQLGLDSLNEKLWLPESAKKA